MTNGQPTPEHPVGDVQTPDDIGGSPIERFTLTLRLDTTLTVNSTNWMKPGCEGSITWKRLPTEQELKDAAAWIQFGVIDPILQDNIGHLSQQLEETRRSRR
jgi:hypothetical protein